MAESARKDEDFHPTVDMLMDEVDDEYSINEADESSLDSFENSTEETDLLKEEQEIPLERLREMYGYCQSTLSQCLPGCYSECGRLANQNTYAVHKVDETGDTGDSNIARAFPNGSAVTSYSILSDTYNDPVSGYCAPVLDAASRPFLRSGNEYDDFGDCSNCDVRYLPTWRKAILVGPEYQASIPPLCSSDPVFKGRLLWSPLVSESKVVEFLRQIHGSSGSSHSTQKLRCVDNEQALYVFLISGFDLEVARDKLASNSSDFCVNVCRAAWSEAECESFENGLKEYGKNFYQIQKNKLTVRSVHEIVEFYYLWKKTDRHDVFVSNFRLEKTRYALHPAVTDFMERFLGEEESIYKSLPSDVTNTVLSSPASPNSASCPEEGSPRGA